MKITNDNHKEKGRFVPLATETPGQDSCLTGESRSKTRPHTAAYVSSRRKSKIAHLPAGIRAWVNESLVEGLFYKDIVAGLEARGFPGINDNNIHTWYVGGHKDWLREQERTEHIRMRADAAFALCGKFEEKDKAAFSSCNELLLFTQINDVLQDYDPGRLKTLMADKPEQFFRLANTINAQAGSGCDGKKWSLSCRNIRLRSRSRNVKSRRLWARMN